MKLRIPTTAAVLALIESGAVEVRYEDRNPFPPELPVFDTIKVEPKKLDRDKPWRRWPVRK